MTEETQNLDSGMNNPTPDTVAMGVFQHDSKRYQPVFVMVPQYDGEMAEIAPKRVGDQSDAEILLPVYDKGSEPYFQAIQASLTEINTAIVRMPYGSNRGYQGQVIADDTEQMLVANPFSGNANEVVDLKTLIIDNQDSSPCIAIIRPATGSTTSWPFQCPAGETKEWVFSGVGPQGEGGADGFTVQLAAASSGTVTISGWGIEIYIG